MKYINTFLFAGLAIVLLWSCKKDEVRVVMDDSVSPTLSAASSAPVVLLQADGTKDALTLNWNEVNYGFTSKSVLPAI